MMGGMIGSLGGPKKYSIHPICAGIYWFSQEFCKFIWVALCINELKIPFICWASNPTILWFLPSICCLKIYEVFMVSKAKWLANHGGRIFWFKWLKPEPDHYNSEKVVAKIFVYVDVLLCKSAIKDVGMPYGGSHLGIKKPGVNGLDTLNPWGLRVEGRPWVTAEKTFGILYASEGMDIKTVTEEIVVETVEVKIVVIPWLVGMASVVVASAMLPLILWGVSFALLLGGLTIFLLYFLFGICSFVLDNFPDPSLLQQC